MDDLRAVLEALASEVPQRELTDAFARIARSYEGALPETAVRSTTDAIAYACGRGLGTYASVKRVLHEIAAVRPAWRPRSLLDVGAGTGSASWAAVSVFDSIERVVLIERSASMVQLGSRAFSAGPSALRDATWVTGDAASPPASAPFDLVVASYVLGEIAGRQRSEVVARWFASTKGELVMVEPGSIPGFEAIRAARDRVIADGATISAPCPHDVTCPMTAGDWCHFGLRIQRSRLHRALKSGDRGFEDEKYSFVVASKQGDVTRSPRVLRRPDQHGGHVRLRLCAADGTAQDVVVAKSEGDRYRRARKLGWGDAFEDRP